ncbi:MAG: CpaF family protein [Bacillota bacterium]|jgi:pilus assembly protein CpaF|nr:CpaF family protein [Bacillota bacterium]
MGLLERLDIKQEQQQEQSGGLTETLPLRSDVNYQELRAKAHREVIERMNKLGDRNPASDDPGDMSQVVKEIIHDAVNKYGSEIHIAEKHRISHELYNEVTGLGPLEQLLEDDSITEIMVNGPEQIYIERNGKLCLSDVRFRDNEHVLNVIDKIVASVGRHVDEASPMVDARLQDGSRVNIVISPVSLNSPVITIRKFSKNPLTIKDLLRFNSLSFNMAAFLEACVKGRMNVVVSGGTGSGKTTLLNVLSGFIPNSERIITIEDAAELRLQQQHVITLESRPPNLEGKGQISIRDLVRNALRMRPDRIVVGEVRGGEALDMLQAMNTGHDGSLTTAHANSPRDLLSRLETMVLMSGMDLPVRAIREQIASAVDVIIQQSRMMDGTRKITEICEVTGMEGDVIVTQELFRYETEGELDASGKLKGRFLATGTVPLFMPRFIAGGVFVDSAWFSE